MAARLQKWFPWVRTPVIVSGPMIGVATPRFAAEVSKAGGIGFLPSFFDVAPGSPHLEELDNLLTQARQIQGEDGGLRVGVSFITGHASITSFAETALPILAKHRPAAVWLFAPEEHVKPHGKIIRAIKEMDGPAPAPRVFVQAGNVTAAREAVRDGADVVVCQGIDAGGHQFRRGMGVVSFVPEARAMLDDEFHGTEVVLLAAGGIANDKGVAAALVLGADGVVMGTRFTVAEESGYPEFRKELVLAAKDGGSATFKSPFNDEINKNALWGPLYDGRLIISEIHEKFMAGTASLDELRRALKEDYSAEDAKKLVNTWAGTGVGMVNKRQKVAEIVDEVREGAKKRIKTLAGEL